MSPHSPLHGSFVALPTPFRDGTLDLRQLDALIDYHAEVGTDGLLVCGTTGESVTLTEFEQRRLMRFAAEQAAGRLPVMAGVGTNSTAETVQLAGYAPHGDGSPVGILSEAALEEVVEFGAHCSFVRQARGVSF